MCGIVAMISKGDVVPDILKSLDLTEYRGYDSAGIVVMNGTLQVRKRTGKVAELRELIKTDPIHGTIGIGHTRWATHGEVTEANAHPHLSNDGTIAVVHNGTIENYLELRDELEQSGVVFGSDTDTEVVPHMVAKELQRNIPPSNGLSNFAEAVIRVSARLKGAYGLAIVSSAHKDELIVVRHTSPVVIGFRGSDIIVASGKIGLSGIADDVITIDDSHMAVLYRSGEYSIRGINGKASSKHTREKLDLPPDAVTKGVYLHFMEKEIFEQPEALLQTLRGRVVRTTGEIHLGATSDEAVRSKLRQAPRFTVVACGTSYHSALVFKYVFERLVKVPVSVEHASEFIYRQPVLLPGEVVIGISQSGETADTLQALKLAREQGAFLYSITNVVGSRMADYVGCGTFLHIGPEIGVASTKAFTAQCAVLLMLALRIAELKGVGNAADRRQLGMALASAPDLMARTIEVLAPMKQLAEKFLDAKRFFFIGRGLGYPLSLEGALKLKEIAYVNAEGYPAGELKHGPLALIEEGVPVIVTLMNDGLHDKVLSNAAEVAARRGIPIIINTGSPELVKGLPYTVVQLPEVLPEIAPLVASIPTQLLAYYMGTLKGYDVDKPRNLAKSVTVE